MFIEKFKKGIKYSKSPSQALSIILRKIGDYRCLNWLSDSLYLKIYYFITTKSKLNLDSPKSYNEKLQWLKLHDRNPEYAQLVDKYEVRNYIKETIGEKFLIPMLGLWNKVDDIDWDTLPNQFVLKTTHDSGGVVICKDKKNFDIEAAKSKLNNSMKRNYYYGTREWPYKNVKPRIVAEKYINQVDDDELRDYRFFCFNGEPKCIAVDYSITDKSKTRRNIYDLDWNFQPVSISYPNELKKTVEEPEKLKEMISLSRKLSKNIPHVRIDFYNIGSKIIFGEMTFYHQSGMAKIVPREFEDKMGSWIELPR